ncbi:hypothetical protein AMS68_004961 [Peltaster fructicola]|uniref:Uncharacterized protein n=1 Tax=Peltaster fructicola TaxID=286661 RepID=A0A6H0XXI7_9PEZI|nr:hypothetical protein AMS68_004961 [Peltaster fructicola]
MFAIHKLYRPLLEGGAPARRYVYLMIGSLIAVFLVFSYHAAPITISQLRSSMGKFDILSQTTKAPTEPPGAIYGPYVKYWQGKHWTGWPNVQHAIIFGDSWSTTAFEPAEEPPRPDNPIGNPPYPGAAACNGANWVGYFTTVFNESLVLTLNMAAGGATVDMDLIAPGVPHSTLRSLKTQIVEQFPALYGKPPETYPWTADSSIFIIWIGLNDIHNADEETQHNFPAEFVEYAAYADLLYQTGARNIMFMNIPPIERAPLAEIIDTYDDWHLWVAGWNANLTSLVYNFRAHHPDATVFLFDTFKLYDDVMNEPCLFPESCGFEVTTKFCPTYAFGAPSLTYLDPKCPHSIDKYFWMNDLHPTTRTHNMTAHAIAQALST